MTIRAMADLIIDTSNLTVHELRDVFMRMSRDESTRAEMVVNLVSFGYKHGVPVDADLVFDVRCLPNPHFVDRLRRLTGRDRAVVRYMRQARGDARFHRSADVVSAIRAAAVRAGREELPDGGHRLHRRPASIGDDRRGVEEVAVARSRACGCASSIGIPERLRPTMIGVVVVTHGQLATELVNAAETIVGDLPRFAAVSIGWHEDTQDAREEIAQAIARVAAGRGVLILTDMFGGTPSNLAMTFLGEEGRSDHRRQPADADQARRICPSSADLLDRRRARCASTAATRSGWRRICCEGRRLTESA